MTVYLVLPSAKLTTHAALMRLWLGTIIHVLTRDAACEEPQILFILDEVAHLGKIQVLEDAITLMRAYGLRFWLFIQSVNQLQKVYGENAQTILDNMGTQIFFGTNAYQSADHISQRIGDCTILVESINRNWNRSRSGGQQPILIRAVRVPETASPFPQRAGGCCGRRRFSCCPARCLLPSTATTCRSPGNSFAGTTLSSTATAAQGVRRASAWGPYWPQCCSWE